MTDSHKKTWELIAVAIKEAVEGENEACARMVDSYADEIKLLNKIGNVNVDKEAFTRIAVAIRARKD